MKIKEIENLKFKNNSRDNQEKEFFIKKYIHILEEIMKEFENNKNDMKKENIKNFSINYDLFNIYSINYEIEDIKSNEIFIYYFYIIEDKKSNELLIYSFNEKSKNFMNYYSRFENEINFKEYKNINDFIKRFQKDDFLIDKIKIFNYDINIFNNIHKSNFKK